jgi:hypothetical protein
LRIDAGYLPQMTRKEVNMSGKIRVGALVFAAALVVLGAWFAFGQGAPGDPCGGHYVGQGLKATFVNSPGVYNIFNDIPTTPYLYPQDCVFLYRAGHVIVGINKARAAHRYVGMKFVYTQPPPDPKDPDNPCYNLPFFMDEIGIDYERAGEFTMKLINEWIASRDYDALHQGLILTPKNGRLQFGEMTPGQTAYCDLGVSFTLETSLKDGNIYMFSSLAKVYYGVLEETGGLGWRVTPIDEHVWFLTYTTTRVKGKTIVTRNWGEAADTLHQTIQSSSTCPTGYLATFYFPFKLILER